MTISEYPLSSCRPVETYDCALTGYCDADECSLIVICGYCDTDWPCLIYRETHTDKEIEAQEKLAANILGKM